MSDPVVVEFQALNALPLLYCEKKDYEKGYFNEGSSIGPGTEYPVGLTGEEMAKLYWSIKKLKATGDCEWALNDKQTSEDGSVNRSYSQKISLNGTSQYCFFYKSNTKPDPDSVSEYTLNRSLIIPDAELKTDLLNLYSGLMTEVKDDGDISKTCKVQANINYRFVIHSGNFKGKQTDTTKVVTEYTPPEEEPYKRTEDFETVREGSGIALLQVFSGLYQRSDDVTKSKFTVSSSDGEDYSSNNTSKTSTTNTFKNYYTSPQKLYNIQNGKETDVIYTTIDYIYQLPENVPGLTKHPGNAVLYYPRITFSCGVFSTTGNGVLAGKLTFLGKEINVYAPTGNKVNFKVKIEISEEMPKTVPTIEKTS